MFSIFEHRKIVQKLRKASYFLAAIVDVTFLLKSPLFKTLNGTFESQEIEFYQCPAGKLGPFLSYSWPFKLHSNSNFAASVLMNK